MLMKNAVIIFGLILGVGVLAYVAVAQGSYPADAVFSGEFNFALTQEEKDFLTANFPNIIYDIVEREGAWTEFVLNGTTLVNRPDLAIRVEDYVTSQRPIYNATGGKFHCQPELIQGKWLLECQPE